MEAIELIEDLAIVMLAAGLLGSLCKRIGLSVIVGYLAAGVLIGPYTPPFSLVHDAARIHTLSQLGLVFLMFSIGLELSLGKLRRLGPALGIAAALGAFLVLNATQLLGAIAHWPAARTMFIAAMLMVSSSAVIFKMLRELRLEHERAGQLALGIAVFEDVVAIVMITILGSYAKYGGAASGDTIGRVLAGLSGFVVLIVMAALLFVPRLLRRLELRADPELLTIAVAGLLLLLAIVSVWAGYSLALGAFLFGAVVADLPQRQHVAHAFEGMRDIFSSVFFVSIGMMINVHLLPEVWPWILGLGAFALVLRPLCVGFALMVVGNPPGDSRQAGLAVSPLGEFSFIIAQMGVVAGVLPSSQYVLAVGVSLVTVLAAPPINRHAAPLLRAVAAGEPAWLRRGLARYHGWLAQMAAAPATRPVWQRSRRPIVGGAAFVLAALWLWRLVPSELLPTGAWWALLLVLVAALALFSRRLLALRRRLRAELEDVLAGPAEPAMPQRWRERAHDWALNLQEIDLPACAACAGRTIGALAVRRRLGCTIVEINRQGYVLAGPEPTTPLFPGDRLLALGSPESLAAARAELTRIVSDGEAAAFADARLETMTIPDHPEIVGRTLRELQIPHRTGAAVAGIRSGGVQRSNPSGEEVVRAGDEWLVIGSARELRALADLLGATTG